MNEQLPDRSGVLFPPPLLFAVFLFLGLGLNTLYPMPFLSNGVNWYMGVPLMVGGFGLGAWAVRTMRRAQTSLDPGQPTRVIVTEGPFGLTRNPIYLSFALSYLGIAFAFNSLLTLFFLPIALFAIDRLVVAREEKYLDRKFGGAYRQYQARVRRWL